MALLLHQIPGKVGLHKNKASRHKIDFPFQWYSQTILITPRGGVLPSVGVWGCFFAGFTKHNRSFSENWTRWIFVMNKTNKQQRSIYGEKRSLIFSTVRYMVSQSDKSGRGFQKHEAKWKKPARIRHYEPVTRKHLNKTSRCSELAMGQRHRGE